MADLADLIKGGHHLPDWLILWGEKQLGLHALNVAHAKIEDDWDAGSRENFFRLACRYLNLNYDLTGLENIPATGPCVVVCNHPHGMSDGLMFGDIAMKVRDDIRIVVNEFLHCVRGMRPYEITVDVYGGDAAKRANMAGMREMLRWLKGGHCLLVFPSGSAATYSRRDGRVVDDPWQTNIATIIRKTGATVVPMHISGRTGIFFQTVSVIAKSLRSNFLAREIIRDGRMRHTIRLGKTIEPSVFTALTTDEALSDYLRLRSMLLRYDNSAESEPESPRPPRDMQPVAPSEPADVLAAEIAGLPDDALYYYGDSTGLAVYAVEARQIPHLMQELGVQREQTFRTVGEGSGKERDLDAYDRHYLHLIMWDTRAGKLAGAYRMGRTDEILRSKGAKGIYNSMFFRFRKKLRQTMKSGLEMGRAFITPEYQKMAASLDTLWMGIGQYVLRHPEYRYLYGTVSISNRYSKLSRALMLSYLKQNCMHEDLAGEADAFFPPSADEELLSEDARLLPKGVPNIKVLGSLVSALEADGKGLPVLLRQYERLGGRMVAFGIDKDFGRTLDCFVIVDLATAPERSVKRYMSRVETKSPRTEA